MALFIPDSEKYQYATTKFSYSNIMTQSK